MGLNLYENSFDLPVWTLWSFSAVERHLPATGLDHWETHIVVSMS